MDETVLPSLERARLALAAGRAGEAKTELRRLLERDACDTEALALLGDLLMGVGQFAEAAERLDTLLKLEPTPVTLLRLVKAQTLAGAEVEARRVLATGRRMFPADADILARHVSEIQMAEGYDAAVAALEPVARTAAVPDAPGVLAHLTRMIAGRSRGGKRPDVAAAWSDFSAWGDPEGLARYQDALQRRLNALALTTMLESAWAAATAGRWDEAEGILIKLRGKKTRNLADSVSFDPAFYNELEAQADADLFAGFAPVEDVRTAPPGDTLYLACDPVYFHKYALPLLDQIGARAPGFRVHIHLLDGDRAVWTDCADAASRRDVVVSVSGEASLAAATPAFAPIYYHAIRFLRFYQHIKAHGCRALMIDVDTDLAGDPGLPLRQFAAHDIGLYGVPLALHPREKILAGCVGIAPTAAGLSFARLVAAYIAHMYRAGAREWGIDQIALFGVYSALARQARAPATYFFQPDVVGMYETENAVFWFMTGYRKHLTR